MAGKAPTITANELARKLSRDLKRNVTGKTVRQWSRDNIARFGDDRYTAHEYSAAEVKTITAAFVARGTRSKVQPKGSKPTASKRAAASKTASKPPVRKTRVHPMVGDSAEPTA
jgi:hypothetical protein